MIRACCRLAAIVVLFAATAAGGPATDVLSAAAYRAELDRLVAVTESMERGTADVREVSRNLPTTWRIEVRGRRFDVSCVWLRAELAGRRHPAATSESAHRVRGWLLQRRADLDAYEVEPPDRASDQARLAAILKRPEFAGVSGPGRLDRLKQDVLTFLVDTIDSLLGSSSVPAVSRWVIYRLPLLALFALAWWLFRRLRLPAAPESLLAEGLPVSSKPWDAWLGEAREAAAHGDWREAVRLAYWSGISSLEARGAWRADRARTPREYLRLVAGDESRRAPLASITATFERVWYARQEADEATFSGAIADLERLGCGWP